MNDTNTTTLNLADDQRLLILMYHHIAEPPAGARLRGLYTTPKQFDGHLRWLRKQAVSFTTFQQLRDGVETTGRALVMVTFDDGLHDNYTNAWPLLKSHGVPAAVFPVMGDLGGRGVVWSEATDQTPADLLSAGEIREMMADNIEFGSHLMDHTYLTKHDAGSQARQLSESKARLEDVTGVEAMSVAYPYGDVDGQVATRAAAAGYRYGLTTDEGVNTNETNPMLLHRLAVKGSKIHHPLKFRRLLRRYLSG